MEGPAPSTSPPRRSELMADKEDGGIPESWYYLKLVTQVTSR